MLAAGLSSRMGANKLVMPYRGKPLVRWAVESATESRATQVIVVTGNDSARIAAALVGLNIVKAENRDFAIGLSESLKYGIKVLSPECDGAVVLLGDMPLVGAAHIDRLIDAFDPVAGRAICLPVQDGRRGNPVLWARRFFPEMMALEGDRGAKSLMARYPELVHEVPADGDGAFFDVDTPGDLA